MVTIKGFTEPLPFLDAVRRQLDALGIAGEVGLRRVRSGPHEGQPRRLVCRVRDRRMVGFSVQVTGLTAQESIKLQENGLGGRLRLACGFFVPLKPTLLP
jgi:CRISPR-associated protein Cas6